MVTIAEIIFAVVVIDLVLDTVIAGIIFNKINNHNGDLY